MTQKKLTTIALGVTTTLLLGACSFDPFSPPSSAQLAAPAVQAPQAPAVQTRTAKPAPKVKRPSAGRASAPAAPAPTRVAAQPTAAPTVTAVKPTSAKPTAESCKVKQVAGCAFVSQQGFGDGDDNAGGGGWDG